MRRPVVRRVGPTWAADLAAAALTLAAFALRLYRLNQQSLTGDEAFSMLAAQRWLAGQMDLYGAGSVESTPPLHYLALHLWVLAAGASEFSGRYLSVAAGTLLVPTIYRLGAALGGRRLGLAAGLLAAANPFLILYSQTARAYSLVAWLSVLSALSLVRLLRAEPIGPSPAGRKWPRGAKGAGGLGPAIPYLAVTLLALYTHTFAALLLVFHNAAYLVWPGRRVPLRTWLAGQALLVALYLPWALRSLFLAAAPAEMWLERGEAPRLLYRVLVAFTLGRSDYPTSQALPLVAVGALLFALGALAGLRSGKVLGGRAAAAYLLAPLAAATLVSLRTPLLRDRFLIPLLPGYLLGVAAGADFLWRRRAVVGAAAVLLTLAPAVFALPAYYRTVQFASVADVRRLQAHLRTAAKEGAAAVVNLPATDPYFQYYDLGMPTYFISDARPGERERGLPALRDVVAQHREIWLVPFAYGDEGNRFVERELNATAYKTEESWFGHIRLARYAVAEAGAGVRRPVDATFLHATGKIRLVGYSLAPEMPTPGGVLSLTLYWQADGPTAKPYTVFTHLDDAQGATRSQRDSEPAGGQRPTTGWRAGEEIADNYGLPLPDNLAPGEYRLEVGFYQLQEGTRLLLPNGENRLVLATVRVGAR